MNEYDKKKMIEYLKLINAIKKDENILDYIDEEYNKYLLNIKEEEKIENKTRRKM